ncbi:protein FAR1-RELATED SEQUENCE 5-like [Helianthus annuus]|uniref:protein FAR1-RELATED SEQUENCE 5-like n=1 Tax=Helianthus annuus TaxID=4232 RepID=UPI001652F24B|nr:protein FAR1-RELATED SEQUENCE 5-like [Helianthus annuus]
MVDTVDTEETVVISNSFPRALLTFIKTIRTLEDMVDMVVMVDMLFNSLDELKKRIEEIANADGFVIVTRRSKKIGGRTGRVWLECDRGSEHQTGKAGSKKTGCPFYLLAVRNHPYETWEIKDGKIEHNHELCEDLSAHAFVRRFTPSEMKLIEQLAAQNMEPRKIFQTIRKQDPDRFHVQKDVQNVVAKIRAEQRQGLTPMQSLENMLINNDFIYETREEPGTEIVTEIFFLHRYSRDMWRAFPRVMLIDATYKTNIYNMPFIQIVGLTPTNKSFIIAYAVVSKERGDNFVWVLERVKSMLDECMEPRVILTDRDLALMGVCAKVFPDASRLLCRWHIQQNVMKHCKGVFNYMYDNWLKDYKEMFVFAWTDKRRNFGNRTTNRVESQHTNLKRYVLDRSSLDRVVGCVREIVETQFSEIRKTFRESIEKRMNHHKHPLYQHLLGKVSHTALDLLNGEAIRKLDVLKRFHSSCGCQMWYSCGLPCACRIGKYMREERPIQLEDIDVFWRKLNFQCCKLIDDDVDVVEELNIVRQQLESHPPAQQKSLMSKIKAVLTPKKSTKKPPVVQQNTRRRPTTKQVQQRSDEASRIDEELRRSSFGDANTCFEGSRQSKYDKPRHSSYVPSQASQQSVM